MAEMNFPTMIEIGGFGGRSMALECAYQRWLGKQRDAKIEALMQRISALENNQ